MPEPRVYCVGLPVSVEVSDDGTVRYAVDTSEAAVAMRELEPDGYDPPLDEEQTAKDAATVSLAPGAAWTAWTQPEPLPVD